MDWSYLEYRRVASGIYMYWKCTRMLLWLSFRIGSLMRTTVRFVRCLARFIRYIRRWNDNGLEWASSMYVACIVVSACSSTSAWLHIIAAYGHRRRKSACYAFSP
jgi:hypothetical protein